MQIKPAGKWAARRSLLLVMLILILNLHIPLLYGTLRAVKEDALWQRWSPADPASNGTKRSTELSHGTLTLMRQTPTSLVKPGRTNQTQSQSHPPVLRRLGGGGSRTQSHPLVSSYPDRHRIITLVFQVFLSGLVVIDMEFRRRNLRNTNRINDYAFSSASCTLLNLQIQLSSELIKWRKF
jgi:hypothetical protein